MPKQKNNLAPQPQVIRERPKTANYMGNRPLYGGEAGRDIPLTTEIPLSLGKPNKVTKTGYPSHGGDAFNTNDRNERK